MPRNLILTSSDGECGDFLCHHWHRSLVDNVDLSHIDVVVVDYGLTSEQRMRLQVAGANCVDPVDIPGLIVNRRFRDYAEVIAQGSYDQVLTIDGGDVIFQSDISHLFREHTDRYRCVTQDRRAADLESGMTGRDFAPDDWLRLCDFLRAGRRRLTTSGVLAPAEKIRDIWRVMETHCHSLLEYGTDLAVINYLLHQRGFVKLPSRYEFVPGSTWERFRIHEGKILDRRGELIPVVHNAGGRMSRRILDFGYGDNCNTQLQRWRPVWNRVWGTVKHRMFDWSRDRERRAAGRPRHPVRVFEHAAGIEADETKLSRAGREPSEHSNARLEVVLFQRRPFPSQFSIERHFDYVREQFAEHHSDLEIRTEVMPFLSKGILRRVANMYYAWRHQGEVNHVTGDVHYVALVLPARRTVLTVHDCQVLERLRGWRRVIVKWLWFTWPMKRAAALTCVSNESKQRLLEQLDGPVAPMQVAHSPVAKGIEPVRRPFPAAKPRILQIGTKKNKNVFRLVEALQGVDCVLEIVGPVSEELQKHLKACEVAFEHSSGLSDEELLACFGRCDLVAFVSTYEGFGMPIIEAQWAERPVVTSDCSCMPETAGEGACFVDPLSVESIRSGILRVLQDPEFRDRIVAAGKVNRNRFGAAAVAECYADLYRQLHPPEEQGHVMHPGSQGSAPTGAESSSQKAGQPSGSALTTR